MNWKKLTKQQQQQFILIAIVAGAALFALKQFGLSPLLASHAKNKAELLDLTDRLEKADATIKHGEETTRRLAESEQLMHTAATDLMPSPENALAWATKTIYANARTQGLDIESVADLELDGGFFTTKEQEKRVFKPYGVRVSMQCTYDQLVRFVETIEMANPYLTVSGLSVGAQPNSPERHQVTLSIEWPNWKDAKKSKAFRVKDEHDPA